MPDSNASDSLHKRLNALLKFPDQNPNPVLKTSFEGELQKMRDDAVTEANKEKAAILAQAQTDAARVKAAAERTIRDETARAQASLQREAARLSIDLARERLSTEVNADDDKRLMGDFLSTVSDGEVANG